jgi:hypothetical protein
MKKIFLLLLCVPIFFQLMVISNRSSVAAVFEQSEVDTGLTNVGYAAFNLTSPRFNCDGFISSLAPLTEIHVAFLYNTFGNDFSCLTRIMADPRLKTLEVNLINEPGHRNNRLGSYEFLYGVGSVATYNKKLTVRDVKLKQKLTDYVIPIQSVLSENLRPHTSLLINPGLESNVSAQAGRVLVSWTRELFPDARIVWNPHRASLTTRKFVGADLVEGHGQYPSLKAPCVYNMDGTDVKYNNRPALGESSGIKNYFHSGAPLFQQLEKYANRCEVAFVWSQEGNGLNYKQSFRDPRKRNHNISTQMYRQIMRDIIAVHRRGKIAPTTDTYTKDDDAVVKSCSVVSTNFEDGLKYGRLIKQSEFPDRGGVIILPMENKNVDRAFIVKGRKIVDEYRNTGPYHDGRPLFRSDKSPTTYPFNTYLVFTDSKKICFKLPNPRIRLD